MYYDLVLWITGLPTIVLSAIIGGIAGGIGALVVQPLGAAGSSLTNIVSTVFAIGAVALAWVFVYPNLDRMAFEAGFMKGVGELPQKIDEDTILQSAGIYDQAANYTYQITSNIDSKAITETAIRQKLTSHPDCRTLTGRLPNRYISHLMYRYETNLGLIAILVRRHDCL